MKKNSNCIFCQIVEKKIKVLTIYEDDLTLAFLDIKPVEIGHTLVIPKKCFVNILELERIYLHALATTQQKVTAILLRKLKPRGFNFINNHNKIAGQEINHFHFHIIPKFVKNKGFHSENKGVHKQETVNKVWKLIVGWDEKLYL